MRRGISRLRAGGSVVDPAASAWAAAVTANGGTYSQTTLNAVNTFCKSAKASGYWSKLNRISLFAGDQLAACLVPLKVGGGSTTDTNVNFVAGDYTEATGLTGNGTTKYLNTGLIPSVSLALDDIHLSIYNRSGTKGAIGITEAGKNLYHFGAYTDGMVYGNINNAVVSGVVGTPYGHTVASRISSTRIDVYRNGAPLANSVAASSGTLSAGAVYVFALNNVGIGPSDNGTGPLAAYSIGSGLSAADVTAYNTHIQTFQTSLGRQV